MANAPDLEPRAVKNTVCAPAAASSHDVVFERRFFTLPVETNQAIRIVSLVAPSMLPSSARFPEVAVDAGLTIDKVGLIHERAGEPAG